MPKPAATDSRRLDANQDLMTLVDAIVLGNTESVREILKVSPGLAKKSAVIGASRAAASNYFYTEIRHYFYAGDTALHMAGAGFRFEIAQMLIDLGAKCSAKNRRGAEPLHYASDCNIWNPTAQALTIQCLIRAGANPNATDMDGVAPIHRAVRYPLRSSRPCVAVAWSEPRSAKQEWLIPSPPCRSKHRSQWER